VLSAAEQREAFLRIAEWRRDPAKSPLCPVCGVPGLVVVDRSARPHAEWYALSCAGCGLSETLHIPLSSPGGGLD
jgi:hypothetical protein